MCTTEKRGNGYDGYSMSNNARAAYASGSQPMSQWSRAEFDGEVLDELDVAVKSIKGGYKQFLKWEGWHHTSKFFNRTDFYQIDFAAVDQALKDGTIKTYTAAELEAKEGKAAKAEQDRQAAWADYHAEVAAKEEAQKQELIEAEKGQRTSKSGKPVTQFYITEAQPIYHDIITNNKGLFGLQDLVRSIYPDCWHAELLLKKEETR